MNRRPAQLRALYGATLQLQLPDDPDERVEATIAAMRAMIHHSDQTQHVHRVATELATGRASSLDQLRAVFDFLRPVDAGGAMDFKRDTYGKEVLRHPDQVIHEIRTKGATSGDCDDRAMLGAALVRALGFRALLIVVGREATGRYTHVLFGAEIKGPKGRRIIPLDPQETEQLGDWPTVARRKIFYVDR